MKTEENIEDVNGIDAKDIVAGILLALFLALCIRLSVAEIVRVPTQSMEPAILQGDIVLVSKLSYSLGFSGTMLGKSIPSTMRWWLTKPNKNDIIVFYPPASALHASESEILFIKRVIAGPRDINPLGFDTIPYKGMHIEAQSELALSLKKNHDSGKTVNGIYEVGDNYYYVAGDNAMNSYDSKDWGLVNQHSIIGKALIICWSSDEQQSASNIRWERIGTICQ